MSLHRLTVGIRKALNPSIDRTLEERMELIREVMDELTADAEPKPKRTRKAKGGHDRKESGGEDRAEE